MEDPADDVHHCLVNVFATLDTPGKQRKALNGLFGSLSHSRIRESVASLSSTVFTYDIVGNLPLEINVFIFQHLQIRRVFQGRRVSRKWLGILSSPALLDPILQQWDSLGRTPLLILEGLEPQSIGAEHIDAYRRGLAFSKADYNWDIQPTSDPAGIAYADGRLAWVGKTRLTLVVVDLERGKKYSFIPRNREHMIDIAVSKYFVAATTLSGRCYVWELPNGRAHSFRLTSLSGDTLVSSRMTLALLNRSDTSSGDYVTTWNLESLQSYQFPATACQHIAQDVDEHEPQGEKKIMLSNSGQSVIVFERVAGDSEKICFKRLSLDGRIQASGSLDVCTTVGYVKSPENAQPLSSARFPTIWCYSPPCKSLASRSVRSKDGDDDTPDLLRVLYDPEQECLRLEHHSPCIFQNIIQDASVCQEISHGQEKNYINELFFWKDVAYYRANWSEAGLKVIDLTHDTCSVADMGRYTPRGLERFNYCEEQRDSDGWPIMKPLLFGDGIFLVNVFAGGFVAWCFDKNITLALEDKGYRLFREGAIKGRINTRLEPALRPPRC